MKILILLLLIIAGAIFVAAMIAIEIDKLEKIASRAKTLQNQDLGNPFQVKQLEQSIKLYKQCDRLIANSLWLKIAANLEVIDKKAYLSRVIYIQKEIDRRHHFQRLFSKGEHHVSDKYFDLGLNNFLQAKGLFNTEELESIIVRCLSQIEEQYKYEKILKQATAIAKEGMFKAALLLLKPALTEFDREDGRGLLSKLDNVLEIKKRFATGMQFESRGELNNAKNYYQQILEFVPELTDCRIRLAIIAVKNRDSSEALSYLANVNGERVNYIRGFACVIQSDWRQADREWQSISNTKVKSQRQSLRTLAQRDRLLTMRSIEQCVDRGDLEQAKNTSFQFIDKFGIDPLVEVNLYGHIQALIETKVWKTQNWNIIAETAESLWIENQDIASLHNWAVASYYQAQIDPNKIADLIIAWSTALANIQVDPSLKDLPWLGNSSPDLDRVSTSLTELIEKLIDAVKDTDIDRYLQLRDLYRWQNVALRLTKNSHHTGIRVKQLLLSPGCYQRHLNTLPKSNIPAEPWGRLYTTWGQSVAACIEGDSARAIQIQPKINSVSVAEKSADCFVTYHEGCYYLQQQNWRKAITPLKQVQGEIKKFSDWISEIDRLCEKQRQKIDNFDDHLEFAQFWYELSASKPARSYLAEYKAKQIGNQVAEDEITLNQGHKQLLELKQIDEANPIVIDLIKRIEIAQEMSDIIDSMQQNLMVEAVRGAKRSKHQEVKYQTAEIFINILLAGAKSGEMGHDEILQLERWAKEICPYEPAFREVYQSLRL
jgi:tetratricopeptide (TPR) repeat protein